MLNYGKITQNMDNVVNISSSGHGTQAFGDIDVVNIDVFAKHGRNIGL